MRRFVAVLALVVAVTADVSHLARGGPDADAQILKQEADVLPDQYQYSYETSNGIAGQESGQLKNVGREDEGIDVQGTIRYTSPEGVPITLTYVANDGGFQPQGSHLPVAPPIPELIQRSLDYIAAHPPAPEYKALPISQPATRPSSPNFKTILASQLLG